MRAVAMDFYASALMFAVRGRRGLASMSEIEAVSLNWSDLGMSELLPTGTVTLLLADVEGSTRLWETQPDELTAAFAKLDHTLVRVVDAHHGVRPIERGEGDSFVIAFPGQRRSGVRTGGAAVTAGTHSVAHRRAHRRGSAAR